MVTTETTLNYYFTSIKEMPNCIDMIVLQGLPLQ